MSTTNYLLQQATSAQAAYATELLGGMPAVTLIDRLVRTADFTATQAEAFANDFAVVLQYNDTIAEGGLGTGLSLTVFRDRATNALTLAIRGTEGIDIPDLLTDASILNGGAGYDQIVALCNWWRRVSTPDGMVAQYLFVRDNTLYPDAMRVGDGYLVRGNDVAATGALVPALAASGGGIDVAGHSRGASGDGVSGADFRGRVAPSATESAPCACTYSMPA